MVERQRGCSARLVSAGLLLFGPFMITLSGCKESQPSHESQQSNEHGNHGSGEKQGNADTKASTIVVSNTSETLQPGHPITLQFHLEQANRPISRLVELHEKLVHLIVIREGLDEFSHVHPTVDAEGKMAAELTFPVPGNYYLFADYQEKGRPASLAKTRLTVPERQLYRRDYLLISIPSYQSRT